MASVSEPLYLDRVATPIGELLFVADRKGTLRMLEFHDKEERWRPQFKRSFANAGFTERRDPFKLASMLKRYFDGDIAALDEIVTDAHGTEFQQSCWKALRRIPAGTTTSYVALAKKLGKPAAMRAVGLANGANPIAIVVPCHRVVGSDGSLTGYGGGLERKRWLLDHERTHA
jgi:methylated-DNA-[protein]-cysteine S-methyltransferase